jgi:hypothetical protein
MLFNGLQILRIDNLLGIEVVIVIQMVHRLIIQLSNIARIYELVGDYQQKMS